MSKNVFFGLALFPGAVFACSLLCAFTLNNSSIAHADGPPEGAEVDLSQTAEAQSSVVVEVRSVKASDSTETHSQVRTGDGAFDIDSRLEDLRDKLQKLQFHTFKLVNTQKAVVPLKKKQVIPLLSGQTLTVRPLYIENERIGLWLKWKDATGMEILDTRMHFDSDQSMLTGTDSAADSGVILAIDVKPAK